MQRPRDITYTSAGYTAPYPLDRYVNGYGIGVTMNTAGIPYTLQYSMMDPFGTYSVSYDVSGRWFNCDDPLLVNASTNRATNFAFPPRAIRLNVSSAVSSGNPITLSIVPFGMDGN